MCILLGEVSVFERTVATGTPGRQIGVLDIVEGFGTGERREEGSE